MQPDRGRRRLDVAPASAPSLDVGELVSERALRFSSPSLRGRHVELRPIVPEDYTYLQLIETGSELAPRWRLRGATPGPQDWAQGLLARVLPSS